MKHNKKIKFYPQIEQSDCGLACLKMIAYYYGKYIPLDYLKQNADISRSGISLANLKRIAENIGMTTYAIKLNPSLLKEAPLPIILHWNQNHFVVLWKIHRNLYYIADPAGGQLRYNESDFSKHFFNDSHQGICLLTEPNNHFKELNFTKTSTLKGLLLEFRHNLIEYKKHYSLITLLIILGLVADFCIPFLMRKSIDDGMNQHDIPLVWGIVLAQIAIFIGSQSAVMMSNYLVNHLSLKLGVKSVHEYLSKLISLPLSFFETRINSDLIQKSFDREQMQQFLGTTPISIALTILTIIVFSVILVIFNPIIFALFSGLTLIGITLEFIIIRKRKTSEFESRSSQAKCNNSVYELINGIYDLKIHNASQRHLSLWHELQQDIILLKKKIYNFYIVQASGSSLIYQCRDVCITGLCATLVITESLSFGSMITISYIIGKLSGNFSSIGNSLSQFQDSAISLERSDDVMSASTPTYNSTSQLNIKSISIKNLCFHYPGTPDKLVLHNISLTIPVGKTTALVGPSGCWKTTIIKLLQGLYMPNQGQISINDIPLSDISDKDWCHVCSSVSQNGYIFSSTIAQNIALADAIPDYEKISKAIKMSVLDDYLEKLPLGLDTQIGPSGIALSGGETQRLLIARAIYGDTQLVLLDEATSSLDASTERKIVDNLTQYGKNRTMVIAAHRLSTICKADNIVFINNGTIAERGTHEELMALNGHYAKFVSEQLSVQS